MGSCLSKLKHSYQEDGPEVGSRESPLPDNSRDNDIPKDNRLEQRGPDNIASGGNLPQDEDEGTAGANSLDEIGQQDPSSHFKVAVAQAALTQLIVTPWATSSDHESASSPYNRRQRQPNTTAQQDLLQSLKRASGLAVTYLDLQHELVENLQIRTSVQEMTRKNLERLLGSRKYKEYINNVEIIEESFRRINEYVIKHTSTDIHYARHSHNTGPRSLSEQFDIGVNAMIRMGSGRMPNADDILDTQDVLKFLSRGIQDSNSDQFRYLRDRVRWREMSGKHINYHLNVLANCLGQLRDIIQQSGIVKLPGLHRDGDWGYHWDMDLAKEEPHTTEAKELDSFAQTFKNRRTASIPLENKDLEDLDRNVQRCAEKRMEGFGKQTEVRQEDFAPKSDGKPAGKYRGVCKLKIKSRSHGNHRGLVLHSEASGWMYNENTVVTAGHCIYEKDYPGYGQLAACDIDVYLGYSGRFPDKGVERLRASRVLVHHLWFDNQSEPCDVAVIRLQRRFKAPGAFLIGAKPREDLATKLSIVGYPYDVPPYSKRRISNSDQGQVMYESAGSFEFNNFSDFIRYKADTEYGNSGCPILRNGYASKGGKPRLEVVGVHSRRDDNVNKGISLCHRRYGNDIPKFVNTLNNIADGRQAENGKVVERYPETTDSWTPQRVNFVGGEEDEQSLLSEQDEAASITSSY